MTVATANFGHQARGFVHPALIVHETDAIAMTFTARALVNAGEPGPRTGFADSKIKPRARNWGT